MWFEDNKCWRKRKIGELGFKCSIIMPLSHFYSHWRMPGQGGFHRCSGVWHIFPHILQTLVKCADNPLVTKGWSEDVERIFKAGIVQRQTRHWNIACRSLADIWTGNKYLPDIPQCLKRYPPASWIRKICWWFTDLLTIGYMEVIFFCVFFCALSGFRYPVNCVSLSHTHAHRYIVAYL